MSKETAKLEKRIPMRRCIACMTSYPKIELIRIAYREGRLTPDISGHADGRGVYLCRNEDCIKTAEKKKAFNRSFRKSFDEEEISELFGALREIIASDN